MLPNTDWVVEQAPFNCFWTPLLANMMMFCGDEEFDEVNALCEILLGEVRFSERSRIDGIVVEIGESEWWE